MKYEKKYQNQKVILTVSVTAVLLFVVLAIGYVLSTSMVSTPEQTPPPSVTPTPMVGDPKFEDADLEEAVKSALGIDHAPTGKDMEKLVSLDYTQTAVTDVVGLEYAINLKELRLKTDAVTIEPLLDIQLEKLTIVSDVSVQPLLDEICEMKYLKYLDLTNCGISIIGYLSELPMIETMILDDNRVSDLKNFQNIKTLKTLSLKNCNINDISGFYAFTTLETLYIDNNKIEDISVLETMTGLKTCTYEGNPLKTEE